MCKKNLFKKKRLINSDFIKKQFSQIAYANFHGVQGEFLGMGLIYYTLAYIYQATFCVCLGSGGGLVPMLLRQAQRDLNLLIAKTYLIDANLPEVGWGGPNVKNGWLNANSKFLKDYSEIVIIPKLTREAAFDFPEFPNSVIDYLHIDADHTMDGCFEDFQSYFNRLKLNAVITIHDTRYSSVQKAIGYIRQKYPLVDIIDFPDIAQGTAILKRRLASDSKAVIPESRSFPENDVTKAEFIRMKKIVTQK